tara:strand:- start:8118 stop:8705 length:588 start_codon:yes stop_codon:yes gene_type:complete
MRKKRVQIKDYTAYNESSYDEMKKMLNISRSIIAEQEQQLDIDIDSDVDIERKREQEKTKVYTISSGKLIIHGDKESQLDLTEDEKTTYQETMDDFLDQVSDLVDYRPLNLYTNNVEWGGRLVKEDIDFYFTLGESNGVFIGGNMVKLNNDFVDTLENLRTFYEMFSAKWAKVLANRKVTDVTQDAETLDSEIDI